MSDDEEDHAEEDQEERESRKVPSGGRVQCPFRYGR